MPATSPSAGGPFDQFLPWSPALLGGVDERPVLDEAAGIEQIVEVLTRGPAAPVVAGRHSDGAAVVEAEGVALAGGGEIGADRGRVGLAPLGVPSRRVWRGRLGRLAVGHHGEWVALRDPVARTDQHPGDRPGALGDDLVLHLHRLEHDDRVAGVHPPRPRRRRPTPRPRRTGRRA